MPDKKRTLIWRGDDEEEAHRRLDVFLQRQAEKGTPVGTDVTFADYLKTFMTRRELSGESADIQNEWGRVRNHVLPHPIAGIPLEAVTDDDVQDFLNFLRNKPQPTNGNKPLSRRTVVHIRKLLSKVFRHAVKKRLRGDNPVTDTKVKDQEYTRERISFLRPEEIRKLLFTPNILTEKQWLVFSLAIYTGMRQGEIFGLYWRDVHLEGPEPYLVVRYSWQKPGTKNGQVATLPLTPLAVRTLKQIPKIYELVFPNLQGRHHYGGRGSTQGGGYDAGWIKVRKTLGLNPEVTFHGLRHTCATSLLSGVFGPPMRIEEVQGVMRHKSIEQTQVYAKILKQDLYRSVAQQTGPFRDLTNEVQKHSNSRLRLVS